MRNSESYSEVSYTGNLPYIDRVSDPCIKAKMLRETKLGNQDMQV